MSRFLVWFKSLVVFLGRLLGLSPPVLPDRTPRPGPPADSEQPTEPRADVPVVVEPLVPVVPLETTPVAVPQPPSVPLKISPPPITHAEARRALALAWLLARPDDGKPSLEALQAVQAIALHESGYGRHWGSKYPEMIDSRNWGAIQCSDGPTPEKKCKPGCGLHGDSRPTDHGQEPYLWCYRKYTTDTDAAVDLIRNVVKKAVIKVIRTGDADAVAMAMRENVYFEGFFKDPALAASQYADSIAAKAVVIAKSLGENLVFRRSHSLPPVPPKNS